MPAGHPPVPCASQPLSFCLYATLPASPLEVMLKEFKQLKQEFPDRILIASIMEEFNKAAVRAAKTKRKPGGSACSCHVVRACCACLRHHARFASLSAACAQGSRHGLASLQPLLPRSQWEELIERCQETGVDAFEINFSCPHGMPERKMGMAMGQVGSTPHSNYSTCAGCLCVSS